MWENENKAKEAKNDYVTLFVEKSLVSQAEWGPHLVIYSTRKRKNKLFILRMIELLL